MAVDLRTCDDCGGRIVMATYLPDLTRTVRPTSDRNRPKKARKVPLDVEARDRDDDYANYALSAGRTTCHQITASWPLGADETRHTIHFATCTARRRPVGLGARGGDS